MTSPRTAPRSFVDCGIRCVSSISMGSVASRDGIAVRNTYQEVTLGWTLTASGVLQLLTVWLLTCDLILQKKVVFSSSGRRPSLIDFVLRISQLCLLYSSHHAF